VNTREPPASTRTRQLAARAEMNTSAGLRDHLQHGRMLGQAWWSKDTVVSHTRQTSRM
jgi:hypothetical protein